MTAPAPQRLRIPVGKKTGRGPLVVEYPAPAPKPAIIPSAR